MQTLRINYAKRNETIEINTNAITAVRLLKDSNSIVIELNNGKKILSVYDHVYNTKAVHTTISRFLHSKVKTKANSVQWRRNAMKYDCNKTVDFIHEVKRMCTSRDKYSCTGCPFEKIDVSCDLNEITERHIEEVQKWSDSHRQKTRVENFKELIKGTEFESAFDFDESPIGEFPVCKKIILWWNEISEENDNAND